jgi:hypothetical protein
VALQLHDLQGDIVGEASDNDAETKLLTTYNSTEFGVPPGAAPNDTYISPYVSTVPQADWEGSAAYAAEAPMREATRQREAAEAACRANPEACWELVDPIHHYRAWEAKERGEKLLKLEAAGDLTGALGTLFGTLADYIDGFIEAHLTLEVAFQWLKEYGQFLEACVRELHGRRDSHGGCRAPYSDIGPVPDFWVKPVISFCLQGRTDPGAIDGLALSDCTQEAYESEIVGGPV